MKRGRSIIGWTMRNYQITLLMIVLSVALGVFGLKHMPKQEFPDFTIRQGVVVGVYPGATSSEVEEQLTKPLERFLFTYKEVKKAETYSMSRDGIVYVMVELNDNVHNKDQVWSKIKLGLQNLKRQLPSGVLALLANDDFGDTSTILISLESKDKTYRELQTYLEKLEDQLRSIESVSNLRRYGIQKEQISVYLDQDKLTAYGLDMRLVMTELLMEGFTTTGGTVDNGQAEIPLHVTSTYPSELEIADQIVYTDPKGHVIRLKDLARVVREYPDPDSYILNNGEKSIILSMEMRQGYNVVEYGKKVDKILNSFIQELPESVSVRRIVDQPKVVGDSVYSFLRDLFISIIVVILVLMILFPLRSAVVAAVSIPVSIFISIGCMYLVGIPLNTVTLAALIVVLGMIVDNSIIVIDAYFEKIDSGLSRWHAAISSAKDYFGSIFLATACISIIFFPFLFTMTGMMNDFLLYFPFTLLITLMFSLVIAMILIPMLEFKLITKGLKVRLDKKKKFNLFDFVQDQYVKILDCTFRHPLITISLGVASVIIGLFLFMNTNQKMMPFADRDQFAVEIYLPQGYSLDKTTAVSDSIYNFLITDKRVKSITVFNGMSSPRFQATYAPNLAGKNFAQFIVNTISNEATIELLDQYTNDFSDKFPDAYVRFRQLEYTQVNCPIEVRFKGDDIAQLKKVSSLFIKEIRDIPELKWIHTNYEELMPNIQVDLDPIESARLGISKTQASMDLALAQEGISIGSIWEGDYSLPIKVLSQKTSSSNKLDGVKDLYLSSAIPGVRVPLKQVAEVKASWEEGQIVRRNGVRTLSVLALVKRGENVNAVQKKIEKVIDTKFLDALPEGITYEYGGAKEDDIKIIVPLMQALFISVIIIFFFLLFSFKKIGLTLGAMASLLLSVFGASLGLWLFDIDFSVTCILGVISLMGIIVRNTIIMFEHAQNLRINYHYTPKEAAYDAGKRRMLPIFLTSATTAVGVVPMIISGSTLWMPMGVVICVGTIFSTILVVTVLPVFYWKIF